MLSRFSFDTFTTRSNHIKITFVIQPLGVDINVRIHAGLFVLFVPVLYLFYSISQHCSNFLISTLKPAPSKPFHYIPWVLWVKSILLQVFGQIFRFPEYPRSYRQSDSAAGDELYLPSNFCQWPLTDEQRGNSSKCYRVSIPHVTLTNLHSAPWWNGNILPCAGWHTQGPLLPNSPHRYSKCNSCQSSFATSLCWVLGKKLQICLSLNAETPTKCRRRCGVRSFFPSHMDPD